MERTGYFRLIWASKGWLALFAVAAAIVVFAISSTEANQYESKALGQIVSTSQAEGEILTEEQLLSLSSLYQALAKTSTVLDLAHEDPAVKGNEAEFNSSVSVQPEARVGVLGFVATTEDPEQAADFANAYAKAFSEYLGPDPGQPAQAVAAAAAGTDQRSQPGTRRKRPPATPSSPASRSNSRRFRTRSRSQSANPGDTMRVIEPAVAHNSPVSPTPKRDALLALIGALVLGIGSIYLRDLFFDRYRSAEEAARDLGLPLLGEIPKGRANPALESFRTLRTAMMLALEQAVRAEANGAGRAPDDGVALLITGAQSGCGKSYVAANLARTLAAEGRQVVAVDADLRRPTLHEIFGVPLSPGLSDMLVREEAPSVAETDRQRRPAARRGAERRGAADPAGRRARRGRGRAALVGEDAGPSPSSCGRERRDGLRQPSHPGRGRPGRPRPLRRRRPLRHRLAPHPAPRRPPLGRGAAGDGRAAARLRLQPLPEPRRPATTPTGRGSCAAQEWRPKETRV